MPHSEKLDGIYRTGSAIAALARRNGKPTERPASEVPRPDVFVVQLPRGGAAMPLSRRDLMASLSIGIVNGELLADFERALDTIELDSDILQHFEDTSKVFSTAAEMLPPTSLIAAMMGDLAILDELRRRAMGADRNRCGILQARYANWLSWMSQEAGDAAGALWWNDRAAQWAQASGWSSLTAWNFIRRTAMVHSFSDDGLRILDHARSALETPNATPRMKGVAAGDMAYGYALAGRRDESYRILDLAADWLSQPIWEDDSALGQDIIPNSDLIALYRATHSVYLGYGAREIPVLEHCSETVAGVSFRTVTATRAKLARAYANAGQPHEACRVAWDALDASEQVGSHLARRELRRALPVRNRWNGRSDVRDVVHRLQK